MKSTVSASSGYLSQICHGSAVETGIIDLAFGALDQVDEIGGGDILAQQRFVADDQALHIRIGMDDVNRMRDFFGVVPRVARNPCAEIDVDVMAPGGGHDAIEPSPTP